MLNPDIKVNCFPLKFQKSFTYFIDKISRISQKVLSENKHEILKFRYYYCFVQKNWPLTR